MLLEINGKPLVSLELGQLYMLGKLINDGGKKSLNFIGLDDDDENISKRHCVIETNDKEEAFIFDLLSLNGTLLNNKILNGLKKTLLKNGDVVQIGDKKLKYVHQGREMSCDSSGFLEVQKNTSDIVASSPESTTQVQSRSKRSDEHKFLMPIRPTTSFSSRYSDSFAIPETQYCKPRISLSDTNVSIAESTPNKSDGKIKFSFDNQDSFEDDDLCIPETQELAPQADITSSQRQRLLSDKLTSTLKEKSSTLENGDISDGSQFRICTQDYNEGFGEEETADSLHSQIIPIIKHTPVFLNKTLEYSITNSINQSGQDQAEKEMSALKWSKSNTDQESTEFRADCLTPDLFEFEAINDKDVNENFDKFSNPQNHNLLDGEGDEEDLLPTQCLPPALEKVVEQKVVNQVEKPCLEKDSEEILTLSDKENRYPAKLDSKADMTVTQNFEARFHTSISHTNSSSSGVKANSAQTDKNSSYSMLNSDEEDALLTQAFLWPKNSSVDFPSSSNKNLSTKFSNSTFLDDKCTQKPPSTCFVKLAKTPSKQMGISSVNVFKKPDKDLSILKKTSSASSTASENDIDLLMCTPQLIKDNLSLGGPGDLRKHILAAKNKHLFGDDTEDEEDEKNNLVKLINVPKSSLDFDHLLPHLNQNLDLSPEEHDKQKESNKIYKFNISFGKEQDEKPSNSSTSKPSSYSRDERHAARDRKRSISERKGKVIVTQDNNKASSNRQGKVLEKEIENKEKKNEKEVGRKKSMNKRNENEVKEKDRKVKEKQRKQDLRTKQTNNNTNKTEEIQRNAQHQTSVISISKGEIRNSPEITSRLRKRNISDKSDKQDSQSETKQQAMPARRLTRTKSRLEETSTSSNIECKEDIDNISTQPIAKKTRSRSKSKQNDSQDSTASNASAKPNESRSYDILNSKKATKKTERKRKAEAATAVMPAQIKLKRLRSAHSEESLASSLSSIAVTITNVDQELIKDLLKNSKGLWTIATNAGDCDILVMDKPLRTFKFLLAMARGVPIVTSEYLKRLNKSKSVKDVSLKDCHFSDIEFEKKHKFSMLKSLQAAKKQKLFKDYEFVMTAGILPIPQEIKAIIEASGGYVHYKTPPPPKEGQKLFLVTVKEDKKDWHKYRRLNKNIIIVSTEAIMSAIMCQSSERMKSFILA